MGFRVLDGNTSMAAFLLKADDPKSLYSKQKEDELIEFKLRGG